MIIPCLDNRLSGVALGAEDGVWCCRGKSAARRTRGVAGRVDPLRGYAGMSGLTHHPAGTAHYSIGPAHTDVAGVGFFWLRGDRAVQADPATSPLLDQKR